MLEKQKIAANPSEYKTSYTMKNTKTGKEKDGRTRRLREPKRILGREERLGKLRNGKEVSVLAKQGYQSSIDKFKLEDENGNDFTDQILHLPKVYLIFSYKPKEISYGAHPSEEI